MKYIRNISIWLPILAVFSLLIVAVDFRTRASTTYASAGVGFAIKDGDLQKLKFLLRHYADQNSLQFQDIGPRFPPQSGKPVFWVSLAKDEFVEITATNLGDPTQIQLLFYTTNNDPHSEKNATILIALIHRSWADMYPLKVHP